MRTGTRVNKKTDNRGISLVELVVVISIMVVMIGIISLSLSIMFTRDANYVASRIDDELSEARMYSMSRAGAYTYVLHIEDPKSSTVTLREGATDHKVVDLNKSVSITVDGEVINASGVEEPVSGGDGDEVTIEFDKAKGCVSKVNGKKATGVYTITVTSEKNSSKVETVELIAATGRHYIKK